MTLRLRYVRLACLFAAGTLAVLATGGVARAQGDSVDDLNRSRTTTTTVERNNDRPMDLGWLGLLGLAGLLGLRRAAPAPVRRDRVEGEAVARP